MKFSVISVFLLAAIVISGCTQQEAPLAELRIYEWEGYFDPQVIANFEREFNCRVLRESFESNEELYERLQSGNANFDLIVPSSYMLNRLRREGRLEKLNHALLPRVKSDFDPSFNSQILDPSLEYTVPYSVSYTGITYVRDQLPAGVDPESWNSFSADSAQGRFSMIDDMREVLGAALLSLGFGVNSTEPGQIALAADVARAWKKNECKLPDENDNDFKEITPGTICMVQSYSSDRAKFVTDLAESGIDTKNIGFALPKEGFVVAFDEFAILKGSRQIALAHQFIDFIYRTENAKLTMEFNEGPTPSKSGIAALDPNFRRLIIPETEVMKRGQVLKGFDDNLEISKLYERTWETLNKLN